MIMFRLISFAQCMLVHTLLASADNSMLCRYEWKVCIL